MDNNINGEFTAEEIMAIIKQFNRYLTLKGRPCQLLKRQLERIPVNELRQLALDYHIDPANHKKAELVLQLAETMVDIRVLKKTLLELPRETREFLLDVAEEKNGRYISEFESPDLFFKAVQRGLIGMYQDNDRLIFIVTKEVREALEKIMADDAFCKQLYQYETLEITLRASINLYGIVKRNDIIDVYKHYFPDQKNSLFVKPALNSFIADREWVCVKGDFLCFPIFEEVPENVIEENYAFAKNYGRYYPNFDEFVNFFYFDYEQNSDGRERLFQKLLTSIGDNDMVNEIICAAVSIFRTGGVPDDFEEMLMDEWADLIDEADFESIFEAGELFGMAVHAWVFCGHSYNEVCGIATRPSLSVIEGNQQSGQNINGINQNNNPEQQPEKHKPKLRLL